MSVEQPTVYVCKLDESRFFWVVATYDELHNLTGVHGYATSREQAEQAATAARPEAQTRFLNWSGTRNRGDGLAQQYRRQLNARGK